MTDLHDLVAGLTRTDKLRVTVGYRGYTATAPCLLAQLAEAIETGQDRSGTRGVPGSRPPLDMTALDLWLEISIAVRGWATHLNIDKSGYIAKPHESTGLLLPPVGRLLRAVAAEASGRALDDAVDALTRSCRSWTDRITKLFAPDSGHRQLHGAACIRCDATTVIDDRDGERVQVPAIVLAPIDTHYNQLICQACGWTRDIPTYDTEEVPA